MKLLLTNDDGIHATGLSVLRETLIDLSHEVIIVAPEYEKSGVSHSVTFLYPLVIKELKLNGKPYGYSVNGTPADCVKLALCNICPDVHAVISGINLGHNAGPAIYYSGTVAAAYEGTALGLPTVAISLDSRDEKKFTLVKEPLTKILSRLLPIVCPGILYNINLPPKKEIQGVVVAKQSNARFKDSYECRKDPRGRTYFWLNQGVFSEERGKVETNFKSDVKALEEGYITITPLQFDLTHYSMLEKLEKDGNGDLFLKG